ncbi:bifunctional diaminohydroxyphosphoribosylaminopyrimidine deaminase/5-amino-6-(5-phosphoribosylamino)uracil reductase RibD [Bacillus sp. FJAT-45350]|uniref:bifunctional diaminohydroxyphosphoribosylaminopyrimidine deaminase/5-amino-6-(5-phosphoribosylamino)uracil reductase RibD n=1 Tax=Bacillus sp. FJAT-45350 TaxID=2011014 RepID=UPI000BB8114E|nr:bifunctional diaminohydroxyphosphoribosylaminopyrimidine deaminase/5-amino-6-(5-phosphoribosylamino)uracil reductase RibD [Bacillus sp. FJAT-45350]
MNDKDYMKLAIQLAQSAAGQTTPNPLVGSVVVKDGQIIGMGAHLKAGEAHAEVNALEMAGEKAKGATIYVTLEPCSHFGKTPPCADLIIRKELKRVVIATVDPNPKVAGKGIERIKQAGIEVEVGLFKEEADALNKVFYHFIQTKMPYVTMKSATSLDGKTATYTGESKWITGSEAREDVHLYRHQHDGILVGIGTVLADNPSLTTRLPHGGKNPIRIILDHHLRTPLDANVVTDGEADTWIVTSSSSNTEKERELVERGVTVLRISNEKIEIRELLRLLGSRGISSLFVEGGAEINGSFVAANCINQIITYVAPKFIGGRLAPTSVAGAGFSTMDEVVDLEIKSIERIGKDIKIISEMITKS